MRDILAPMRILFFGDIVGRCGREAVAKHARALRAEFAADVLIANADNASGGFGVGPKEARDLLLSGIDVLTGGDHVWDQKETPAFLAQERRLLRPANFSDGAPGFGSYLHTLADGRKLFVLHLLGQVFIKPDVHCPFAAADKALEAVRLGHHAQAIFVDFHAEATSEKNAMGLHVDGRASAVVGSHTHVPTADARVLPKGTAYHTDAGMCGDYNSIIGFAPEGPMHRFLSKIPKAKMQAAEGKATLCGTFVETDDATGKAKAITAFQRAS